MALGSSQGLPLPQLMLAHNCLLTPTAPTNTTAFKRHIDVVLSSPS